jgi:hypothetical protein
MKKILVLIVYCILFMQCKKFYDYRKEIADPCFTESLNPEKIQDTVFEPAFLKTFDDFGHITHIKMQVVGYYGELIVFDHDITYTKKKALLKGCMKVFYRFYDCEPCNGDEPYYIKEIEEDRNEKDIEILLDTNSGFATEVYQPDASLTDISNYYNGGHIKLFYNDLQLLDKVVFPSDSSGYYTWKIVSDENGNIIGIHLADSTNESRITYHYSSAGIGRNLFYEPSPPYLIHAYYSLLEALNWGPFQPKLERLYSSFIIYEGSTPNEVFYSDHKYSLEGNLVSYSHDGGQSINNVKWECKLSFAELK